MSRCGRALLALYLVRLVLRLVFEAGYQRGQWDAIRASLAAESARIRATIEARQLLDESAPPRKGWRR